MSKTIIAVIKFILAVLLLPVVIAVTVSFYREVLKLGALNDIFWGGVMTYVLMHLFVYIPMGFYQFGQRLFADLLRFSQPLASVIPLTVPLYSTLILIIYYLTKFLSNGNGIDKYFMFFVGFTLAMHIVLTAQDVYDEDANTLKPHYFLSMSLVYIFNMAIVSLLCSLSFDSFEFSAIVSKVNGYTKAIYTLLFRQFFG